MNQPLQKSALVLQAQGRSPASEATHIEQSRAIAQVQGALIVAQQRPRDTLHARNLMEESCQLQALAEHAFFRYNRGGSQISGPSIHLAAELARCWGNVDYGINELRRDDVKGESEMLAYAWDLERNSRVTNTFIVPHKRDKRGGGEVLTEMRDIYENNANAGARRLRECIFRILPKSFVEEAKAVCIRTLEQGGGEPVEKRRAALLEAFAAMGVTRAQIEKKIGRKADQITALDIGNLRVIFGSIKRGEATIADEFETDKGADVAAGLKEQKVAGKAAPKAAAPAKELERVDEGDTGEPDAPADSGPDGQPAETEQDGAQPQDDGDQPDQLPVDQPATDPDDSRALYDELIGEVNAAESAKAIHDWHKDRSAHLAILKNGSETLYSDLVKRANDRLADFNGKRKRG